ncbi:MAG: histidine triad nucleotide-binding protein [Candidatus Sericytochromatia bacterium]|nr:histidine triad nucleotide-binding protein [Candidatus Sericytochromatia bacterium]
MSESCLFCRIVAKEIPVTYAYEDEQVVAFDDINQQAPIHILVIPKRHIRGAGALTAQDNDLVGHIFQVVNQLAVKNGVAATGYRIVTNNGDAAGQSVDHLHFHLLGGRDLGWPPG